MEKHGTRIGQTVLSVPSPSEEEVVNEKLSEWMEMVADATDSPQVHQILRNSALTLLELPEHTLSAEKVYELLSDDQVRALAIKKLAEETPSYWSEEWNALWKKDVDPLLSEAQQRAARRISLETFWSNEWGTISTETRSHVANTLKEMVDGN